MLTRAGLDAAAEDVGIAPPSARLRVEAARGRRHLAEKFRRGARVVQQVEARVGVKAADDLVVVDLHHRIPAIHHLRELREREAVEVDQRRELPAVIRGADLRDDAFQRGALVGALAHQHRTVLLAILLPGDFRARRLERLCREPFELLAECRSLGRRHRQRRRNLVDRNRDRTGRLGVRLFDRRRLRGLGQQRFAGRRRELCQRVVDLVFAQLVRRDRLERRQVGAVPLIRIGSFQQHELRGRRVAGVDAVLTAAHHDDGQ